MRGRNGEGESGRKTKDKRQKTKEIRLHDRTNAKNN